MDRQQTNKSTPTLPELPPRAKLKFDHLNFRKPGDTSAEERADDLKHRIENLSTEEGQLKGELNDLREKYMYRTEMEEAERSLFRLKILQQQGMRRDLSDLCNNIGEQFLETKKALEQALIPRKATGETSVTKELATVTQNLENVQLALSAERLRQALLERRLNQLHIALRRLKSDESSKGEPSGTQVHGESNHEGAHEVEEQQNSYADDETKGSSWETVIIENTGTAKDPELSDLQEESDREEKDEKDEKNGKPSDEGDQSNRKNDEEDQVKGHNGIKSSADGEDKSEERLEGEEVKARRTFIELMKAKITREIGEKTPAKEACDKEYDELKSSMESIKKRKERLEKRKQEEEKKDLSEEYEEELQEREARDQVVELEELEREIKRREALKAVRESHDSQKKDRYSGANRDRQYDQTDWEPDQIDSGLDNAQEESHLNTIHKMIGYVEALEKRVRSVRHRKEKLDSMANLRRVFEREHDLERRWLRLASGQSIPATTDNLVSEEKDHFSSAVPENLKIHSGPLRPREIRLLVLLPAPEAHYPLMCTLETHTWEDSSRPKYAALSYYWGSDICNGRLYLVQDRLADDLNNPDDWGYAARYATRVPIRNNLFRALLRLRRRDHRVALWVDAMCIDQQNLLEKTEQLGQMINVYSKAENVCVWLGERDADGRSDEAMRFVTAIMDFAVLDRYAKDKKQAKKWLALAELMRDRWFSRRWVFQEISLALDKATVHCGGKMVQWSDFADAVSLLASNQGAIKDLFDYSEWRDGPNTLGDVQSFGAYILLEATSKLFLTTQSDTGRVEITKYIKSLESLVTSLKTFDTSDQRDLIYSLVSIAGDVGKDSDTFNGEQTQISMRKPANLKPDYKKTAIEVYIDFTRFCIQSSRSLDVICRPWAMPIKEKETGTRKLPSWIPLLSKSEFGEPEEVYSGRKNGDNLVGLAGQPHYKASGGAPYDVGSANEDPQGRTSELQILTSDTNVSSIIGGRALDPMQGEFLLVRGFKLAMIRKVSARTTGGVIPRESLEMGGWGGIKENTARVPDEIWRTLVADRDPEGQIPPTWYQRACLRCLEIADTFNNGDLNVGELLQGHSDMLRKYLTRVRNVTWNRRFFQTMSISNPKDKGDLKKKDANLPNGLGPPTTKEGDSKKKDPMSLFGLGPPEAKLGDFICILYGCSVPVVLRKSTDNRMILIGEAYVHGKMEGEATEDRQKWDLHEEVYKLK